MFDMDDAVAGEDGMQYAIRFRNDAEEKMKTMLNEVEVNSGPATTDVDGRKFVSVDAVKILSASLAMVAQQEMIKGMLLNDKQAEAYGNGMVKVMTVLDVLACVVEGKEVNPKRG